MPAHNTFQTEPAEEILTVSKKAVLGWSWPSWPSSLGCSAKAPSSGCTGAEPAEQSAEIQPCKKRKMPGNYQTQGSPIAPDPKIRGIQRMVAETMTEHRQAVQDDIAQMRSEMVQDNYTCTVTAEAGASQSPTTWRG